MPKSPESMGDKSEASREAEEKLKNVRKLEEAGARVLSDSEKEKNREEFRQQLRQFENKAHELFEKYGHADVAIGNVLIEMGWK